MRKEVTKINIATAGKSLLNNIDVLGELPIAPGEVEVLKASSNGIITQGKTGLPPESRQPVIQSLVARGVAGGCGKKSKRSGLPI